MFLLLRIKPSDFFADALDMLLEETGCPGILESAMLIQASPVSTSGTLSPVVHPLFGLSSSNQVARIMVMIYLPNFCVESELGSYLEGLTRPVR